MNQQNMLRCTIMRGGTSKAIFFKKSDLPVDPALRAKVILAAFGSPDMRQIDGLGGAWEGYSKVAIIGPPTRDDADIDYTFGQVQINKPFIDWSFNCGNISSAVGPYAIAEGMIGAVEPLTTIRIHLTNSNQIISAEVPVKEGLASIEGDYEIAGVPGSGARIDIDNCKLAGSSTGKLLPSGNVIDELIVDGLGKIPVSIVDIANPFVFVHAKDVRAKGTESRPAIMGNQELLNRLVAVRCAAAEFLGFVKDRKDATEASPSIPCLAFIHEPVDYVDYATNEPIRAKDLDFIARNIHNNKAHETFMSSGSICTAVAAMIEGTVVNKVASNKAKETGIVRFGHPRGIVEIIVEINKTGSGFEVKKAVIGRTARRILDGYVYINKSIFEKT